MRIRILVALLLLSALLAACRRSSEQREVRIVTTPDIADTAIADVLASAFGLQRQSATKVIITEERFIPSLVDRGLADVVVTISPALRQRLSTAGRLRLANTFATEEFVIVGPRADPARVRNAPSAAEAFRRIARRDRTFCSPVELPDLREREARIWTLSPANASDDRRYRQCRGDAVRVLRESSRRAAYTLTDLATFEAVRDDVKLEILLRGEPQLVDRYMILLVADPARNRNALWFVQWVMSVRAHDVLAKHRFEGHRRLVAAGRQ